MLCRGAVKCLTRTLAKPAFCRHQQAFSILIRSACRVPRFEHYHTAVWAPAPRSEKSTQPDSPFDTTPDTIYALSTATGRSAIAVIRISGPACLDIYRGLCPGQRSPKPRTATLRRLYDSNDTAVSNHQILDPGAILLYFPAPLTVTGEDVLELHVHGGPAIVRSVLASLSQYNKRIRRGGSVIRHAEAGEFTKRAFYNGRIDLPQAEALGETLAAETEQQRRLAVSGANTGLSKRYEEWRKMLVYARGELEALIDFSEDQHFDESPQEFTASVTQQVKALQRQLQIHIGNATKGELLRNGISVALLGAPNAGKSSLLNRIVGREAAIVSSEEGTTRDIVDVSVDIDGWLCRLGDMAGLRPDGGSAGLGAKPPVGLIEREGIRRARERALQSDVVVVLLSVERMPDDTIDVLLNPEVLEAVNECQAAQKMLILAINKVDLLTTKGSYSWILNKLRDKYETYLGSIPNERVSLISCRAAAASETDTDPGGIHNFLATLTESFSELTAPFSDEESGSMTPAEAQSYWTASLSVTHRQSVYLQQCLSHLNDYLDHVTVSSDATFIQPQHHLNGRETPVRDVETEVDILTAAEHLRFASLCLARITGKGEHGDVEDVLGVVFEK